MKSKEINVVHVITTIERGGAENAVLALAQEQVRRGYKVIVIPLKGNLELNNEFNLAGVTTDTSLIAHSFLNQVKIFRKKYKEDVIFHAHLPRSELLLRLCKAKYRYFVTRHNTEKFFPHAPNVVSRLLSRFVTSKSDTVIAISHAVLQFIIKSREISNKPQTTVIYYGYTRRCKNVQKKEQILALPHRTLRIGTISRLAPQKNLNLLIELGLQLKAMRQEFLIQIVGEGPDKSLLENRVREKGLENKILFLGKKSNVMPFLQELDFFVLTSNYEGFGLVLLEAMDATLPIIASCNSAIPEVLGENHLGLFKSGDSQSLFKILLGVLQIPSTYEEIMKLQSIRLDNFTMDNYFNAHHKLFASS